MSLPGSKTSYRLFNDKEQPICDIIQLTNESAPIANAPCLCMEPYNSDPFQKPMFGIILKNVNCIVVPLFLPKLKHCIG